MTDKLVALVVGPNRKEYYVHHDLVCDRSSYFRAALQGQFQEAQTNRIEFPEEAEATLELFIRWLYGSTHEKASTSVTFLQAVTLMGFARQIVLPELHNHFIDAIRYRLIREPETCGGNISPKVVDVDAISLVYHAVPKQTHLRFCVCLEFALQISRKIQEGVLDWMSPALHQLLQEPGEFAADFVKLLIYCNQNSTLHPGMTFALRLNWIYHMDTAGSTRSRSARAAFPTLAIKDAARIFDKNLIPDMGDKGEKQGSGL